MHKFGAVGNIDRVIAIISRYFYGFPCIDMFDAFAMADKGNKMYLYRFDWDFGGSGAGHTLCSGIATGCVVAADSRVKDFPNYDVVYKQTSAMWNAFIKTQNPNVPELPEWPTYNKDTRLAMFLDVQSHVGEIEHTDPGMPNQTLIL